MIISYKNSDGTDQLHTGVGGGASAPRNPPRHCPTPSCHCLCALVSLRPGVCLHCFYGSVKGLHVNVHPIAVFSLQHCPSPPNFSPAPHIFSPTLISWVRSGPSAFFPPPKHAAFRAVQTFLPNGPYQPTAYPRSRVGPSSAWPAIPATHLAGPGRHPIPTQPHPARQPTRAATTPGSPRKTAGPTRGAPKVACREPPRSPCNC